VPVSPIVRCIIKCDPCEAVIGTHRSCFVTSITVAFVLVDDNTESILTNIACSSASCVHVSVFIGSKPASRQFHGRLSTNYGLNFG